MVLCPPFRWASRGRFKLCTVPADINNLGDRRETIYVSVTIEKYLVLWLDFCCTYLYTYGDFRITVYISLLRCGYAMLYE